MKLKPILLTAIISLSAPLAIASGNHEGDHGHDESEEAHGHADDGHDDHGMSGSHNKGDFQKEKNIDGYNVSFHVMNAKEGMKMGDESHHFMIKVEKDGNKLDNIKVNSKIVHPNGKAESKMLMKMGGWYMAGYDLGHQGKHQMMILFKTADGKKHSGGVYYTN